MFSHYMELWNFWNSETFSIHPLNAEGFPQPYKMRALLKKSSIKNSSIV